MTTRQRGSAPGEGERPLPRIFPFPNEIEATAWASSPEEFSAMNRITRGVALIALSMVLSGCGDGASNSVDPESASVDYGKKSMEKMKEMYPNTGQTASTGRPKTASDRMNEMYSKKR
jgi:hypothetical protein